MHSIDGVVEIGFGGLRQRKTSTPHIHVMWMRSEMLVSASGEMAPPLRARAFAHELDHLDGLLFLDRADGASAIHPRKRYL